MRYFLRGAPRRLPAPLHIKPARCARMNVSRGMLRLAVDFSYWRVRERDVEMRRTATGQRWIVHPPRARLAASKPTRTHALSWCVHAKALTPTRMGRSVLRVK
jgi:hypothetical protein